MSWFKKAESVDHQKQCSFCKAERAHVRALVAGPGVSICETCIALSAAIVIEQSPVSGLRLVIELLHGFPPADRPLLAEAFARAACALARGDAAALRELAAGFETHDEVAFARAIAIVYEAFPRARFDATDARRASLAALLSGDLDIAAAIEPAGAADPRWTLHAHLVAFLRGTDVERHLADVRELHGRLDADTDHALLADAALTEAIGHVAAHNPQRAVELYASHRGPALRPWHRLAFGDALAACKRRDEAIAVWRTVADHVAWEPYWPAQARERL